MRDGRDSKRHTTSAVQKNRLTCPTPYNCVCYVQNVFQGPLRTRTSSHSAQSDTILHKHGQENECMLPARTPLNSQFILHNDATIREQVVFPKQPSKDNYVTLTLFATENKMCTAPMPQSHDEIGVKSSVIVSAILHSGGPPMPKNLIYTAPGAPRTSQPL